MGYFLAANLTATCLLLLCTFGFLSCSTADPFPIPDGISSTVLVSNLCFPEGLETRAPYEGYDKIRSLHVFVFNDDILCRLDSYCSLDMPSTPYITFNSSSGDKRVVMIANLDDSSFSISEISNYDALEAMRSDLRDEDPLHPVMSGECQLNAGAEGYTPIQLTPVLSNICLDFVKTNFSGRGYRSTTLENACAYLTNVSGSAEILRHDGFKVQELVNADRLDERYISSMRHPEMLKNTFMPGQWKPVNFYCYPNDSGDGIMGSEHTRLVIQGDIDGHTYYYPIEINQEGFGYVSGAHGVSRNIKYSYAITITRKGSTDPSIPVGPDTIVEKGWINLHPGQFITGKTGDRIHVWCDMYPEDTPLDIAIDDLEYDVERGIYTYELDPDGHGVTLTLMDGGTGMFTIDAASPIVQGFLVMIVVNP